MSKQRYTPEFKDEAVRQVLERGYSVAEVSERLGVSSHSYTNFCLLETIAKVNDRSSGQNGGSWPRIATYGTISRILNLPDSRTPNPRNRLWHFAGERRRAG